jgi:RNA polymerase sigma factor (sigma-70 family)
MPLELFLGLSEEQVFGFAIRYARLETYDSRMVEDIVQDTWVRLTKASSTSGVPRSFPRAYIKTTVHSSHIDMLRRNQRSPEELGLDGLDPPDARQMVPDLAVRNIEERDFRREIAQLPREEHRKAVWAVAIEGLNVAEAARQLQMPRSTLVSQLKAALKELRAARLRERDSVRRGDGK